MKRWRLRAFSIDRHIARTIAKHTDRRVEFLAKVLTRLADERLLLPLCSVYWLASRAEPEARRNDASHLLLTITVTTALPHLLKAIVARERPDRVEIRGYRHGIPRSGKAFNAFPSGHAVHLGALASALARMAPNFRALIWSLGSFVALTRVVLLAHWMSDVVVGEALGITIENTLNALNRKPES